MQYAQLTLGYSALSAAVAFAPFALPVVALSALSFRFAPRLGLRSVLATGLGLIAVGFASMTLLHQDSPYLRLALTVLVIGSGIGLCTASATAAIMSGVRDERQGLGSAVNDAAREIGAAIGIAVAGSVLAERYTHIVGPRLPSLPDPLRAKVTDSPGAALQVADALGANGERIREAALDAFLTATHSAAVVLAMTAGGAALWVAWRTPAKSERMNDDRQIDETACPGG
jgi:MFS family permease